MAYAVWKFPLTNDPFGYGLRDVVEFEMPAGATILTVQTQAGRACLWALVDREAAPEPRAFAIVGTGHPLPDDHVGKATYVGTFQIADGRLVFHVFALRPV